MRALFILLVLSIIDHFDSYTLSLLLAKRTSSRKENLETFLLPIERSSSDSSTEQDPISKLQLMQGRDKSMPLFMTKKTWSSTNKSNRSRSANKNYQDRGRPSMERDRFSKPSEKDFQRKISELPVIRSENDLEAFTEAMKTLAYSNNFVNYDVSPMLLPILTPWVEKLDKSQLSNWIWSMGRLGFKQSNVLHKDLIKDLIHRLISFKNLSGREVTTSMGGIGRLNIRWQYLEKPLRDDIFGLLIPVCSELNDREIGNVLHAMAKISIPWTQMPLELQKGLLDNLKGHSEGLMAQQGTMSVYSLGALGMNINEVSKEIKETIFFVSRQVLAHSAEALNVKNSNGVKFPGTQQTSNILYGLAKLECKFYQIPSDLRALIDIALRNVMELMNEQEVANSVYSLGVMNAKWDLLSQELKETISTTLEKRYHLMIPQGVSNSIYGMALLGVNWKSMSPEYHTSVQVALEKCLNRKTLVPTTFPQLVSNVIYSLGLSEAEWSKFAPSLQDALLDGMVLCGPHMSSQEISNLIYGLGLQRVRFHHLPPTAVESLTLNLQRISLRINEQETCSTLHGLAKMETKWALMSDEMRKNIKQAIMSLLSVGSVCLSCCLYSLGQMEVVWSELPADLKDSFFSAMAQLQLSDQSISNTIYGLCLMKVKWASLDSDMQKTLWENLSRPQAFSGDVPQHISNTLWALAKMDVPWSHMPSENLLSAMNRCIDEFADQEIANAVYGLAVMDASWDSLSLESLIGIEESIYKNQPKLTVQEIANIMYSIAILTFDFDYSLLSYEDGINNPDYSITTFLKKNTSKKEEDKMKLALLWRIHKILIETFISIDKATYEMENYDQFAIYFEFLKVAPGGKELVNEIIGYMPCPSGPMASLPSRMHSYVAQVMLSKLNFHSKDFSVFNEFLGTGGVFPIDSAIYYQDELVAFVEIDGEFHYKQLSQQLRRKDRLKEFLYRFHFPHVPLYRMRSDQILAVGTAKAGEALAHWIIKYVKSLDLKEKKSEVEVKKKRVYKKKVNTTSTK